MHIQPVLLAGGSGSRLAPLSSAARPKPFIPFSGESSLYQCTLARVQTPSYAEALVIGQASHRFALLNHAFEAGCAPTIMLEQTPGGTALAVALAALHVLYTGNARTVMAILPCDHFIENSSAWRSAVAAMAARISAATAPQIGLIGIHAQHARTGLGYIEASGAHVARFVEKPTDPAALLTHGRWFYNSGQFIARAGDLRSLFLLHAPNIWRAAEQLHRQIVHEHEFLVVPPAPSRVGGPSFDQAIVQPAAAQCLLEPMPCAWEDLGTREMWCAHTDTDWQTQCAAPVRIDRPWGYFYTQHETAHRAVKHLHVYPGKRLSLQRHAQRTEHWRVLSGIARVTLEGTTTELEPGQTVLIGRGWWHRLENAAPQMLVIEEIQEGLPNEADIERAEDDFGRVVAEVG